MGALMKDSQALLMTMKKMEIIKECMQGNMAYPSFGENI